MSTDAKQFGSLVPLPPKSSEPACTASTDRRSDRDGLDISHGCWASKQADVSREGWFQTRLSLLSFDTLDQGRFFSTDIRTRAAVEVDVEAVTRAASVFANQTIRVSFVDGLLEVGRFLVKLSSDVNVSCGCVHTTPSYETAFHEFVWIAAKNFSVLASSGFTFVGVDNEVSRSTRMIRMV